METAFEAVLVLHATQGLRYRGREVGAEALREKIRKMLYFVLSIERIGLPTIAGRESPR